MSAHGSDSSEASESLESSVVSSTTTSNQGPRDDTTAASSELAGSLTKVVKKQKMIVSAVILVCAIATSAGTFWFARKEEIASFEHQYLDYAQEIIDLVHVEVSNLLDSMESLSTDITSFALDTDAIWPQVTIPHFELRAGSISGLSKSSQISFVPLVPGEMKSEWETYALQNNGWVTESFQLSAELNDSCVIDTGGQSICTGIPQIDPFVFIMNDGNKALQTGPGVDYGLGSYGPIWQQAPISRETSVINYDILSHSMFERINHGLWETKLPVFSEVVDIDYIYQAATEEESTGNQDIHSFLLYPIFSELDGKDRQEEIVGLLVAVVSWEKLFSGLLHTGTNGFVLVLHDTCDDHVTYRLDGAEVTLLGEGDLHDRSYGSLKMASPLTPFLGHKFSGKKEHCEYDIRIYPSATLEDSYLTRDPIIFAIAIFTVFVLTAIIFSMYDLAVARRQDKVMATAKRTNAIVSSLFPTAVRDRILEDAEKGIDDKEGKKVRAKQGVNHDGLRSFLGQEEDVESGTQNLASKPIAELFPATTILQADIVGFTAWSSVREPTQVFELLETVFRAFDDIAKRRGVFKVETIGDCYVAVTGLPEPRKDHAVVMARFARDCLYRMNELTKELETTLGPDTADLSMRFGLHSGPVTAGVLRGDRSRFQLFGDTMNVASLIESSGLRGKIHMSKETATLIMESGKKHWVQEREGSIQIEGKGSLKTYFLNMKLKSGASERSGSTSQPSYGSEGSVNNDPDDEDFEMQQAEKAKAEEEKLAQQQQDRIQRLVDWNSDVLVRLMKQIVARRNATAKRSRRSNTSEACEEWFVPKVGKTVIDEVKEIIRLPAFDATAAALQEECDEIDLPEAAVEQLREYIRIISTLYRDNPFHNYEHASHVTMSVVKLLARIVAPQQIISEPGERDIALTLHDHTYGITSDPLTQFACVFAALIHDVDHNGVPNTQLVKEELPVAKLYDNKSVAEQNSVDLAWDLLQDSKFTDFRALVCATPSEERRFRELVVNCVMATDIMDKDLKALRNKRWEVAFEQGSVEGTRVRDNINRKATIVIEHLIQASDVAHTMQHWHVYRKWNERLFHELYRAFKCDRGPDPSAFWYKGEIGFFDFYIIPLAKKLKECGVFGVSSDEYLNYAMKNRSEFEAKGEEVVAQMIEKYSKMYENVSSEEISNEIKHDDHAEMERRIRERLAKGTEAASMAGQQQDKEESQVDDRHFL